MSEKQQDIDRKRRIGKILYDGISSVEKDDSPENTLAAGLRTIGIIEERGEDGSLTFKVLKGFTIFTAKTRFWTPEQIEETIQEGKNIEKLRTAGE